MCIIQMSPKKKEPSTNELKSLLRLNRNLFRILKNIFSITVSSIIIRTEIFKYCIGKRDCQPIRSIMPIPPQVVKCYKYIDSQEKIFIEELRELVAIPSISSNPKARSNVDFAIKWMQARLLRTGFTVELKGVGSYVPDGETTAVKFSRTIIIDRS